MSGRGELGGTITRGKRAPVCALLLLAASLTSGLGAPAQSQEGRPALSVATTISAEPGTETLLAVRIGAPEAVPKGSFIRIRGLPPTVAVSEGYSIAPGSWAVPIAALPKLKLTLPASAAGKSDVSITLVGIDGTILAQAKSTLLVAAPPAGNETANRAAKVPPAATILRAGTPEPAMPEPPVTAPSRNAAPMTEEQRARALRLLDRGNEHLAEGGIAQARLLYERAAEAGLAQAAMALAGTYDHSELQRLGVQGLKADHAQAQRWYERARQLGAPEAEQRLRRLSGNR
jgi:hypothetical protein